MQQSVQNRHRAVWFGAMVALLLSLPGCGSPTASNIELLQTGQTSYAMVVDGGGIEVEIDYTFSNETGHTVYLPNCQGSYFYRLERLEGDTWITAWDPPQYLCLGEPIMIAPGETFSDTVRISGTQSDTYTERVWTGGTFRIVWSGALKSYGEGPYSEALLPIEHRVSNSFELRRPN
jgi:hypothetical protein